MSKVAIVEDSRESTEKLVRYIGRFGREHGISLQYEVFSNGLNFISDYTADFDVIFMDIEMPHMDGLEAARRLREKDEDVCLIFVTNLAQYAIEGYSVRALDFLVKPVEYQNFSLKLQRALEIRSREQPREIVIGTPGNMQRIRLDELRYIEVMDHSLIYHTGKGEVVERGSIREREAQLSAFSFARCSNSFLVNLRYVTAMDHGEITVDGRRIPVGRTKRRDFLVKLTEYMGDSIQ